MNQPLRLPVSQSYHPTTFLERGVLVPFTTPLLAGTRARPSQREGAELIVQNPSGGRGVYILPWTGVRELCRPTVHDVKLNEKVTALRTVTPSLIRGAAREIAAEGLAGHEARDAATTALKAEQNDRILTNFLLVMALVRQVDPSDSSGQLPEKEKLDVLEERAKRTIATIAPRIGRPPETIAIALEELASVFEGAGVEPYAAQSRLSLAIEGLARLQAETRAWSTDHRDDSGDMAAMIADVAQLTIVCARKTLIEAQALTGNVAHLLGRWEGEAEALSRIAGRPDWLLDGWDHIRLLWRTAPDDAGRRAVLPEMATLVPVIPKEAATWVGLAEDDLTSKRFRKLVGANEDWRTGGQVLDMIARNEHLRALAA